MMADPMNLCAPVSPTPVIQNKITFNEAAESFRMNGGRLRVAMSEKRMRIGCNEITIEAARKLMELHASRFGLVEERFQEIQYCKPRPNYPAKKFWLPPRRPGRWNHTRFFRGIRTRTF
jgi:hypothetical protein